MQGECSTCYERVQRPESFTHSHIPEYLPHVVSSKSFGGTEYFSKGGSGALAVIASVPQTCLVWRSCLLNIECASTSEVKNEKYVPNVIPPHILR